MCLYIMGFFTSCSWVKIGGLDKQLISWLFGCICIEMLKITDASKYEWFNYRNQNMSYYLVFFNRLVLNTQIIHQSFVTKKWIHKIVFLDKSYVCKKYMQSYSDMACFCKILYPALIMVWTSCSLELVVHITSNFRPGA